MHLASVFLLIHKYISFEYQPIVVTKYQQSGVSVKSIISAALVCGI